MPVLMIQGTASHVGKSTLVAALCRIASNAGYRVAPFKAQNMSLNATVTPDGGEIGRAQYTQAEAARVVPTVQMNPILLKPTDDQRSQVIVLGRAIGAERAAEYFERRDSLWPIICESLDALVSSHDLVVVEGAGSPAEINLASREIVNMRVAVHANAPVVLVGDIERGGVFASLYGTVALLDDAERNLIRGFVINKFRGDPSLIEPGPTMLAERTGIPTLGVIPYMADLGLPEEDTLGVPTDHIASPIIDIAVIKFPHMANFDDFDPLRRERGVGVRFVERVEHLGTPDLIVLPGTKTTVADLEWLRGRGFALKKEMPILGICGGYQMLGREIRDPLHVESSHDCVEGLGLLPVVTTFEPAKTTKRLPSGGYEIHNGISDGPLAQGNIAGTYVHGLFDDPVHRRAMLRELAARKGVELDLGPLPPTKDAAFDALADHVSRHCDVPAIFRLVGLAC
ncbi:MAG TPA: cobyric acid synthase [Gemmatimonadaceae bacterium]|nr:cobyric acid synthase [Gemmatimonadaceae bacterium]